MLSAKARRLSRSVDFERGAEQENVVGHADVAVVVVAEGARNAGCTLAVECGAEFVPKADIEATVYATGLCRGRVERSKLIRLRCYA
jgi:hypothetical protein